MTESTDQQRPGSWLAPILAASITAFSAAVCLPAVAGGGGPVLVLPAPAESTPLAVALPKKALAKQEGPWQLVPVAGGGDAIPAQLGLGPGPEGLPDAQAGVLFAVIPGSEGDCSCCYVLCRTDKAKTAPGSAMSVRPIDDKSLGIWEGDRPVLVYNFGPITAEHVPESDRRRTRACYIHPLYGLDGEVLTADFPRDHYHHHGVSWTWPHVRIAGKEYDLWADRGIRQQFVAWLAKEGGPIAATVGVENGWLVGDRKVMIERVWIRAYRHCGPWRAVDIDLTLIPVEETITLWGAPGKSYGGLMVRFAPPSPQQAVITVPDGVTSDDLLDTRLPWADFSCRFSPAEKVSGAAVFVPPDHPDYPPTWLTRHYGPLCVGWPGVKPKSFAPGETIRLSYRIWIHRATGDVERIDRAYRAYQAARKARFRPSVGCGGNP